MNRLEKRMAALLLTMVVAAAVADAAEMRTLAIQPAASPSQSELDAELAARLAAPLTAADCVTIALERNVALGIARAAYEAARTRVSAAYGAFLPELTVSGTRLDRRIEAGTLREETETSSGASIVTTLPLGTTVEAGYTYAEAGANRLPSEGPAFRLTQPLLRGAGMRTATGGLQDARLAAAAESAHLRAQVLQLTYDVQSAYLDIARRRRLIEVNQQAVARDEELVAFSRAKVESHLATQRDVLSAEILLAQDRARLISAQSDLQAAMDRLTHLMGLDLGRPVELPAATMEFTPLHLDMTTWIARALRDNPDVRRARIELERDALGRDIAANARLPRLDVGLAYDDLRTGLAADPTNGLGARERERTWKATVSMIYPLFNQAPRSDYRRSRLEYEQGRRLLQDFERRLTLEVRDTVRNLQRTEERIAILDKSIHGARAKVEFAKVNFQLGRASNLDITEAQKDLLDAETEHVNELVNHRVERSRLEQLLGSALEDQTR